MDEAVEVRTISPPPDQDAAPQLLQKQTVVMLRGPGVIEVGLRRGALSRFSYAAGDLILCRTHTEEWVRWPGRLEMVTVALPDHALQAVAEEIGGSELELEGTSHLEDKRIQALMDAIDVERAAGFLSGRLYMDSIGQALASILVRTRGTIRKPMRVYHRGLTPHQLRRVINFLNDHLERNLTLRQIAQITGLSTAYFSQQFRQSTGLSPHQYLLRARVERAKNLLKQPNSRILDVAVSCGFQTQQHFARIFREFSRTTPTQYRRQVLR